MRQKQSKPFMRRPDSSSSVLTYPVSAHRAEMCYVSSKLLLRNLFGAATVLCSVCVFVWGLRSLCGPPTAYLPLSLFADAGKVINNELHLDQVCYGI